MDITSANSQYSIVVPEVFTIPQTLQGYATDDAFSTPEVDTAEVMLGVDGKMSSAFIPFVIQQEIVFQADSPSITEVFETWIAANIGAKTNYLATNGIIILPAISKQYTLVNGVLSKITPIPQAKKALQPQKYQITWEGWFAQPYGGL